MITPLLWVVLLLPQSKSAVTQTVTVIVIPATKVDSLRVKTQSIKIDTIKKTITIK